MATFAKKADKAQDADFLIVALLVLVFLYFAMSIAANFGAFSSRVPLVERALAASARAPRLQAAGITRISRGYHGLTSNANYLAVTTKDGQHLELSARSWESPASNLLDRRYVLSVGSGIAYAGAEPVSNETKDDFMAVIERDIDEAISAVSVERSQQAVAQRSWQ